MSAKALVLEAKQSAFEATASPKNSIKFAPSILN